MSGKLLHIHCVYLTHLLSFIHPICLSCSSIALIEFSQVIQEHSLQNLLEKLPPHWSSLWDLNQVGLPLLKVYKVTAFSKTQSRILALYASASSPSPLWAPPYSALLRNLTHCTPRLQDWVNPSAVLLVPLCQDLALSVTSPPPRSVSPSWPAPSLLPAEVCGCPLSWTPAPNTNSLILLPPQATTLTLYSSTDLTSCSLLSFSTSEPFMLAFIPNTYYRNYCFKGNEPMTS